MGLSRITALEILTNYPDNIKIESIKHKDEEKWGSIMYLTRNGHIHKIMLSYDNFPFDSEEKAKQAMEDIVELVQKHDDL